MWSTSVNAEGVLGDVKTYRSVHSMNNLVIYIAVNKLSVCVCVFSKCLHVRRPI